MSLIEDVPELAQARVNEIAAKDQDAILKVITTRNDGAMVGVIYACSPERMDQVKRVREASIARGDTWDWRGEMYRGGMLWVGRADQGPQDDEPECEPDWEPSAEDEPVG